jgi:hypothetical protein
MANSLLFGAYDKAGVFDALRREMPLIFIDRRGRKCTGITAVLPAEFGLEKTAKTLELPQVGGYAGVWR